MLFKKLHDMNGPAQVNSRNWLGDPSPPRARRPPVPLSALRRADYPVRTGNLNAAYAVAAARPSPRDRVVMLPADI